MDKALTYTSICIKKPQKYKSNLKTIETKVYI